ncbi:hypothetical protein [Hyphomicrobium sp.]|jgi:hypothetical protein|uniref:hypothetical protein n=1 Tax=Hyphomicrobium sp. TaxID=82 RepID=UPI00356291FF
MLNKKQYTYENAMPFSKYDALNTTSELLKSLQGTGERPASIGTQTTPENPGPQKSEASVPLQTQTHAGPEYIQSSEHRNAITALMTYTTNILTDNLVRIHDGVIAQRDGFLLVERKELIGKTPEGIQAHFSLAFVPRFLCDATIPLGSLVTLGKTTNDAGQRVSIFKAVTSLQLSNERSLTPQNIPYVPSELSSPAATKPALPKQEELTASPQKSGMFSPAEAANYLKRFYSPGQPVVSIPDEIKMVGPDRLPYIACDIEAHTATPAGESGETQSISEQDRLIANLVQSLLIEGRGLALLQKNSQEPIWVYKYADLLCFSIFGSLKPPADWDGDLYASTIDKPVPIGSKVIEGKPSDDLLPAYVKKHLERKISDVIGRPIQINPRIMEYPELDTLKRFRLNISTQDLTHDDRAKIGALASWFLPYAVFF